MHEAGRDHAAPTRIEVRAGETVLVALPEHLGLAARGCLPDPNGCILSQSREEAAVTTELAVDHPRVVPAQDMARTTRVRVGQP